MKSLKIDTSKKFKHYGEKIKQVAFHPEQPLLLAAQYSGKVTVFNYENQTVSKILEVSDKPLRCAIWLSEDRILTAGDDLKIRVFNFHTTQKLMEFEGHKDFIRRVIFNPITKDLISCSDEKNILHWKLSDNGQNYLKTNEWKEHTHFVMDIKFNLREDGNFASCSLDMSIKLWNLKSNNSNGTLKGHKSGVNCISYFEGDRPLLISGGDDLSVIVWDLSARSMIRQLKNHEQNVVDVAFMNKIPLFLSVSEDGKLNFYSVKNFEFCFDLVNFMNKGWSLNTKGNYVSAGYDEGCVVIQLGNDRPLSSSNNGKLVWSFNSEVFGVNLKAVVTKNVSDLQALEINPKELGNLEIFPKQVSHNDNGQLLVFHDGSEYAIYKALSFKLVLFGEGKQFVWGIGNKFAVLDNMNEVVIQLANGEVQKNLKFDFYIENIFGGKFLGIASNEFVLFYDWEGEQCIGKIDVEISDIFWCQNNFVLKSKKISYFLNYEEEKNQEESFQLQFEINEQIFHGFWLDEFFFFTDELNKFKLFLKGKSFTLATFKNDKVILDYLKNHERFFFFDNEGIVTSVSFSQLLLQILKEFLQDLENIKVENLKNKSSDLTENEKDLLSKILIIFDKKEIAYQIAANLRTKFDLAIELNYLKEALEFCEKLGEPIYWKKLGDLAVINGDFEIAEKSYWSCEDTNSLLLLASCLGNREMMMKVGNISRVQKHYSVAFLAFLNCREIQYCLDVLLDSKKYAQAAIFAKNYCPSQINGVFEIWKNYVKQQNPLLFQKMANPLDYKSEYPDLEFLIQIEKIVEENLKNVVFSADQFLLYEEKLSNFDFYTYGKEKGLQNLDIQIKKLVSEINNKVTNSKGKEKQENTLQKEEKIEQEDIEENQSNNNQQIKIMGNCCWKKSKKEEKNVSITSEKEGLNPTEQQTKQSSDKERNSKFSSTHSLNSMSESQNESIIQKLENRNTNLVSSQKVIESIILQDSKESIKIKKKSEDYVDKDKYFTKSQLQKIEKKYIQTEEEEKSVLKNPIDCVEQEYLGSGAFGIVVKGFDKANNIFMAVKLIRTD